MKRKVWTGVAAVVVFAAGWYSHAIARTSALLDDLDRCKIAYSGADDVLVITLMAPDLSVQKDCVSLREVRAALMLGQSLRGGSTNLPQPLPEAQDSGAAAVTRL